MQKNFNEMIREILFSSLSAREKAERLQDFHSRDIAEVLEELSAEERLKAYKVLGLTRTAEIFSFYDGVKDFIEELNEEFIADVLEQMDSDEAMAALDELDEEFKEKILSLMEKESRAKVEQLDSYDDEVIGSYMSDNFIAIPKGYTIKRAMSTLVKEAGEHDNISMLYITEENKLYGVVKLRDLILARTTDALEDLCMTSYPSFYDDERMEDCLDRLKEYAEETIPVLQRDHTLLGVIPAESLLEAIDEELKDDYAKLGGLSENETLYESTFSSVKKRIPWLVILLFLGIIVSSVIGVFEAVIAALPAIVFFQSMVLDMAGNVGTQSLAVTIRNISNTEIKRREIRRVVAKEVRLGFLNGIIVGIIGFVFVLCYLTIRHQEIISGDGYQVLDSLKVSGIISFSLLTAMTLSSFIGTIFPILLDKLHIDPAVASGPFITTINDIIAVVVYYGLTYIFFILLL